jgi:hypothetical protein
METKLSVKGSEGRIYQLELKRIDQRVTATCNCKASIMGFFCKHRISILAGDFSLLLSKEDEMRAQQTLAWPEIQRVTEEAKKLLGIQAEIDQLKKDESKIKKALNREFGV